MKLTNLILTCVIFSLAHNIRYIVADELFCEPLKTQKGVSLECLDNFDQRFNCSSEYIPQGSRANLRCKNFYKETFSTSNSLEYGNILMECLESGKWTNYKLYKDFSCSIECGKHSLGQIPFIIYGDHIDSWPWQATLFRMNEIKGKLEFICGGTLIHDHNHDELIVISAAHCLFNRNANPQENDMKKFRIVLGAMSSDYKEILKNPESQILTIKKLIVHPNYNDRTYSNDIAIIRFNSRIEPSENIKPACLPNPNEYKLIPGVDGAVAGFGLTEDKTYSQSLLITQLPVVGSKFCEQKLRREIKNTEFCSGYTLDGNSAVCVGDSGGGFFIQDEISQEFILHGIVSQGFVGSNGICSGYSIFTKVGKFIPWILYHQNSLNYLNYLTESESENQNPESLELVENIKLKPDPHKLKDYEIEALKLHNELRKLHQSPKLNYSPELAQEAQKWADYWTHNNNLEDRPKNGKYRENLYILSSPINMTNIELVHRAINNWYSKKSHYDWENPKHSTFSQLVWKSTTDLGIGIGISSTNSKKIVIATYHPPGNVYGKNGLYFEENVFPQIKY